MAPRPRDAEGVARKAFTTALGTSNYRIIDSVEAVLPDGSTATRLTAVTEASPNAPVMLAVSSDSVFAVGELEASVGRRLFVPAFDRPPLGMPGEPARVTIDPPRNDWTLRECSEERETVTVTIPRSGATPKADVYLLSDTTGSMGPVIDAVKAGVSVIVNNPALVGFDVAYGVGNYKDFPIPESSPYAFQHQLAPTTDLTQIDAAVATWTASGGKDLPEGQLYALHQIAADPAIGWRPDAKRILVWFGDAPAHDPVCASISGLAFDLTEGSVTGDLVAAGITAVVVSTNTGLMPLGLDDDPNVSAEDYGACTPAGVAGQGTRIAAATSGSFTSAVDPAAIVATLVDLIEDAVTATGNVRLVPTGAIVNFVDSISPAGGYGPLPGDAEHVLPFEVTWKGTEECHDEDTVFTGTLDVVADGVVVAAKPVRVTVPACRYHHVVEMLCGQQDRESSKECSTVVPGQYASMVTIYNPSSCPVEIVKYFAPLVIHGDAVGREPRTVDAKPFAKITLGPGQATMDDCCALEEAVGRLGGAPITIGILDIVATAPLVVTAVHTVAGAEGLVSGIDTRRIKPRRD